MKRVSTAVWHQKYNRWQINVQKDNKRRSFYSSTPGRNGQRECHRKADLWLDENIEKSYVKTEDFFLAWIEELKITTGRSHWSQYEGYWRHWIKPEIGNLKIENINEQHLQKIILAAFKKGLAKKTLKNIRACMTAFIKYCRKHKATTLVVENVYIPRDAPIGKRTILQPEDLKKLFNTDITIRYRKVTFEPYIYAFRFEALTGLRPGEVIGLKWSDINFEIGTISIKRAINAYDEETKGKNENALRTFAITPSVRRILEENKSYLTSRSIHSDYVFSKDDGTPIKEKNYYKRWIRYRNNAGIASATPYELRHTFVSIVKNLRRV